MISRRINGIFSFRKKQAGGKEERFAKMETERKRSLMDRFLNTVEVAGNKLPDPATLFILLAVFVLVLSAVFGSKSYLIN